MLFRSFEAANQWKNTILFIPAMLAQITLPLLASSLDNKIQFNKIYKINLILNFSFSITIAIILSLFSELIMSFYGADFKEGKWVLIILTFSTILTSINYVKGDVIAVKNKMWIGLGLNLIWSLVLITFTYFFLNLGYGAKGLALGLLLSYTVHSFTQSYIINKLMKK